MIKVTLKGDVVKEYEAGTTVAEIAKSILDSAGIFCVLNDEYISAIYSVGAFPIRLMVRSEDAEDAQQLLKNENY